MRHIALGICSAVFVLQLCLGQETVRTEIELQGQPLVSEPEAVTGCRYLWDEYKRLAKYAQAHPEVLLTRKAAEPAWNFEVGSQYSWWARNFTTSSYYQTASTCRAKGSNCYVFVEDSLWNVRVTQAQVDSIQVYFDSRTPAFTTKGIYQVDVETFGDPPNIDNDQKIIILILNILDGFTSGSPSFVAGYFDPRNELALSNSNQAEIYYLDANPLNLGTAGGLTNAIRTTAHEFQHMIHWRYDGNEISFVNEGLSEVAEVVVGYPIRTQTEYVNNTDVYLLGWNNSLADYARAARWVLYLWNQFPNGLLKLLVANPLQGILGIEGALAQYTPATSRRFGDLFPDWLVANHLNDRAVNERFGYTYSPLEKAFAVRTHLDPNVPPTPDGVQRLAADYVKYGAGSNLSVTFSTSSNLEVKAIEIGTANKRVLDVTPNTPFNEPLFGSTYYEIVFIIINNSQTSDGNYIYTSTGSGGAQSTTLSYEGSAAFFTRLPSGEGEKYAVRFSPPVTGQLSAVRIAFNGGPNGVKGSGTLNIRAHKNALGSIGGIPGVQVGSTVSVPFSSLIPGAYNEISFNSANVSITSGEDFHVSVDVTGSVGDTLQLLVDDGLSQPTDRSSTYRQGVMGPGWYNFIDPNSGFTRGYNLLLRATLLYTVTGVERLETVIPTSYSLSQNFPNPFNPSTKIEYQVPVSEQVVLKIYDMLGREVRTLVDELQQPGTYRTEWDGRDNSGREVVSGVYFYQLKTRGYLKTNKMMLVR